MKKSGQRENEGKRNKTISEMSIHERPWSLWSKVQLFITTTVANSLCKNGISKEHTC